MIRQRIIYLLIIAALIIALTYIGTLRRSKPFSSYRVDTRPPSIRFSPQADIKRFVKESDPPDLAIFFTGELQGSLMPCGCRGQGGGLARRAAYVKMFGKLFPTTPVLQVDAGNFAVALPAGGLITNIAIVDVMNTLGVDVANVAERELSVGPKRFAEAAQAANPKRREMFQLISSNFVLQDVDSSPVTDPYFIKEVTLRSGREIQVGFIGINRQLHTTLESGSDEQPVIAADIIECAEKYVEELKGRCSLIVALCHLDESDAERVATQVDGIDFMLCCFGGTTTKTTVGNTTILYSGKWGERVGEVRLFFDESGKIKSHLSELIVLAKSYPEDPRVRGLVVYATEKRNELYREQAQQKIMEEVDETTSGTSSLSHRYRGAQSCASCHEAENEIWSQSGHAKAFETLEQQNQSFNPNCTSCHATGHGRPSGFTDMWRTPDLTNVQCEACHGPQGGHLFDVAANRLLETLDPALKKDQPTDPAAMCIACHTKDRSEGFDYDVYWLMIAHGKER